MLSHIGFINLQLFNKLPRMYRSLISEAAREAEDFEWSQADNSTTQANNALKAMSGVAWYEPTGGVLAQWQNHSVGLAAIRGSDRAGSDQESRRSQCLARRSAPAPASLMTRYHPGNLACRG